MAHMERQPLVRIALIDQCLRSRKYTSLRYLMDELGASRRTVFRDIGALEKMGAPVVYSREFKGYSYLQGHTFKLPELELTEGDLFAVILAEQLVNAMDRTYLAEKIEPSLQKLRVMFKKKLRIAPDKAFSFCRSPQPALNTQVVSNIELILKALGENKKIRCSYNVPGRDTAVEMILEPYHLHFRGKWYLFGWSEYSRDFRTYAVQRMEAIELLPDKFSPRVFDARHYLGDAWGIIKGKKTEVVLEFTEEQAVFLQEKQWHTSQKITKHKKGMMRMTLTVDGLDEVFWWILSYGSNVKVIKPKELGERVKAEAKNIIKQY